MGLGECPPELQVLETDELHLVGEQMCELLTMVVIMILHLADGAREACVNISSDLSAVSSGDISTTMVLDMILAGWRLQKLGPYWAIICRDCGQGSVHLDVLLVQQFETDERSKCTFQA